MRCGAVIVGAGAGSRLGLGVRKALVELGGASLLERSSRALLASPEITSAVLVVHEDDVSSVASDLVPRLGAAVRVVAGGARRQDSVRRGLEALDAATECVLVHDAARPFVAKNLVARLVAGLARRDAVVPAIALTSTIKRVDPTGRIVETVPREALRAAQTPQAARRDRLLAALRAADAAGRDVTDEMQALEAQGVDAWTVEGSRWNIKVTTREDLALAEWIASTGIWREDEE